MALSLQPPAAVVNLEPEVVKFNQKLVDKLKYCKEVLISIRTASAQGGSVQEESEPGLMGAGAALNVPSVGLGTKASRTTLR